MLTFWGKPNEFCDGVSRRDFLSVGSLALGAAGLTLADLLRLEAAAPLGVPLGQNGEAPDGAAGARQSAKSVIQIFLPGGPPHMDMYDLKPDAPKEYRGEFKPIDTNVPGMQICELFPRQARHGDKLAILRAVVGSDGSHSAWQFMTGHSQRDMRPAFGSVVGKLYGAARGMPPYVALRHRREEQPSFLGAAHRPFEPNGPGLANLRPLSNVDEARLRRRRDVLSFFDSLDRKLDTTGTMTGMDEFTRRAFEMISSGSVREAFDVSKEDPRVLELYGGRDGQRFLQARRLVEAGCRVVTLSYGGWDTHNDNFKKMRRQLPVLDRALTALIEDLQMRGLLDDVAIVMFGEFGRTPKVNNKSGRDHWPQVMSALLAGGGLRGGQTIGSTDRLGERANNRPITIQQIHATLYRVLGIDPAHTFIDGAGRPTYIVDDREEIPELG